MLVVCDTTPLNYLLLINQIDLIPQLFESACIPEAVFRELTDTRAPVAVREWAAKLPSWISVERIGPMSNTELSRLDAGEQEALALAISKKAEFLLTDDAKARVVARTHGVATVTTLLILDAAADRGLVSFPEVVGQLLRTNFRVNPKTIQQLLDKRR